MNLTPSPESHAMLARLVKMHQQRLLFIHNVDNGTTVGHKHHIENCLKLFANEICKQTQMVAKAFSKKSLFDEIKYSVLYSSQLEQVSFFFNISTHNFIFYTENTSKLFCLINKQVFL
jgi:hypothetical protein